MAANLNEHARDDALVLMLDPDGWIEMVGHGSERLTGWTPAQLARKNFEILGAHAAGGPARAAMSRAMADDLIWHGEGYVVTPGGQPMGCRFSVHPLHDEAGKRRHFVCTIRPPLSEQARDEELARARAEALAAARAKNDFVRNMSHELRTPMNGILGMADHLLQTDLGVEQRADLVMLRRSAGELLAVLGELLAFSGLEASAAAAERVPFRLRALLREIDVRLAGEARERGLSWALAVDGDVPDTFDGDPGRLRHVLGRLADNAIKFTERGSVSLRVRLEGANPDSARVAFEMTDTGIGIPEAHQRAIFEPFGKADSATTRRYGGIGLGLTLAARQVETMGGRLAVRSRIGQGSTFSFTLSLARAPEAEPPVAGLPPGTRVLFVGGGPAARTDGAHLLRPMVGELVEAPTVNEAADALIFAGGGADRIHAVVIDARGAAFDPFEVAAALAEPIEQPVPMLLLVTSGQRGDADRCRALGIGAYLTSPVTAADLGEALALLVTGRPLATPGAARVPAASLFAAIPAPGAARPLVTRHSLREARRPLRVLVVDDNGVNRTVATRILERAGCDVEVADCGRRAIERFAAGAFDVVLMDVAMPEMDGLEATRHLRELERASGRPRTPIIAVTAHALESDRLAVRDSEMDGFIPKPIEPEALLALMGRLAGRAPEGPAGQAAA